MVFVNSHSKTILVIVGFFSALECLSNGTVGVKYLCKCDSMSSYSSNHRCILKSITQLVATY